MRLSGLEPETSRLSGGCSNQLSYRRVIGARRWFAGESAILKDRDSLAQAGHGIIGYRLSKTPAAWIGNAIAAVGKRLFGSQSAPKGTVRDAPSASTSASVQICLIIPRKEVIQPHLPIRLPCYDLVPLTGFTFGASILAVRTTTSGATNSGGLTGGVYKAQEQIHRGVADPRLLAIPASCGRIAAHNLN